MVLSFYFCSPFFILDVSIVSSVPYEMWLYFTKIMILQQKRDRLSLIFQAQSSYVNAAATLTYPKSEFWQNPVDPTTGSVEILLISE